MQVVVGTAARDRGERGWVLDLLVVLMDLVLLGDWVFVDIGFGGVWEERGVSSGGGRHGFWDCILVAATRWGAGEWRLVGQEDMQSGCSSIFHLRLHVSNA